MAFSSEGCKKEISKNLDIINSKFNTPNIIIDIFKNKIGIIN
jgi:hypothetical protein